MQLNWSGVLVAKELNPLPHFDLFRLRSAAGRLGEKVAPIAQEK